MIKSNIPLYRVILVTWLAVSFYVLLSLFLHPNWQSDSEVRLLFYLQMLTLTFPLGYIAGLIAGGLSWVLDNTGLDLTISTIQYTNIITSWVLMVIIGFLQWLVWLPKLFKKVSNHLRASR